MRWWQKQRDPGHQPTRRYGLGRVLVRGRSMLPTLRPGDQLLVYWGAPVTAGRLVIVRLPDATVAVKRATHRDDSGWWVERDNPHEGVDSWAVGAIAPADVLGVVIWRYWSPRRREQGIS